MTKPTRSLLIIEDDPGLQRQMSWCFDSDIEVLVAGDGEAAMGALRKDEPGVVTLDLGLPPDPGGVSEGFRLLQQVLSMAPHTKVIVVTGREETDHSVRAIGMGAFDYYQKPVDADTLRFVVERAFRIAELERENARLQTSANASPLDGVIASSDAMLKVCRSVEKIGPTDVSTLVIGETGTGKELIARALHDLSGRADGPFVAINCAAIPDNLLESELFGYEKGAFTGASAQKQGKIEYAQKGTLFLDEVGDMPLALQAKMLRFLQERSIERLGGHTPIPVDVRLICATHRDLKSMIAAESFREDLFYRIGELVINVPPIRDRAGDTLLIANALLKRFASDHGVRNPQFTDDARAAIEHWDWPGNVREMENRVKRAVILCEGNRISAEDLELDTPAPEDAQPLNLRQVREEAERTAVLRALNATDQNVTHAARLLGITRPTLYSLISKFELG